MALAQKAGHLVLKLKHSNTDPTGSEGKNDVVRFRLLSVASRARYFSVPTYRRDAKNGLLVAVRMKSDGG